MKKIAEVKLFITITSWATSQVSHNLMLQRSLLDYPDFIKFEFLNYLLLFWDSHI